MTTSAPRLPAAPLGWPAVTSTSADVHESKAGLAEDIGGAPVADEEAAAVLALDGRAGLGVVPIEDGLELAVPTQAATTSPISESAPSPRIERWRSCRETDARMG